MHVFVGSTNVVKINSAKIAVEKVWPDAIVEGVDLHSGVSHQPRTDEETKKGAENRARKALELGLQQQPNDNMLLGIGLEGGVFEERGEMWSTVWCAVIDQDGNIFFVNGARLKVPESIAEKIRSGLEMAHAMEAITGRKKVKSTTGMLGIITKNYIDRTEEYAVLAKLAVGLWYGRDWEKDFQK